MSIFDGEISYGKYKGNKTTELTGYFGVNMGRIMGMYFSGSKVKHLFIDLYSNKITFYSYFTLEIYEVLLDILSNDEIHLNINRKALRDIVIQLKQTNDLKYMQHTDMDQETIDAAKHFAKNTINMKILKKIMNFGVLPHQEIIFTEYAYMKYVGQLRGNIVAADPGTGKTFASLALVESMEIDRIIIIAPKATLEAVWVDSITGEMYKKPQKYWLASEKKRYYGEKFIIAHYEYIPKLKDLLAKDDVGTTAIIIDESHNMNEKGTRRDSEFTQLLKELDPSDVILLSGTAIKGSTLEVSNLLKFTDVRFTPEVEEVFENLYKSPTEFLMKLLPKRYAVVSTFVSKDSMKLPPSHTVEEVITLKNGDYYTLEKITERMKEYGLNQLQFYNDGMEETIKEYTTLRDIAVGKAIAKKDITELDFQKYNDNVDLIRRLYVEGGLADIPQIVREANTFERLYIDPYNKGQDLHRFREVSTIIKYVSWKIQGEILARVVMRTRIDLAIDFAKELDYKDILTRTEKKTLLFSGYGEVCEAAYNALSKHTLTHRVYWDYTVDVTQSVSDFHSNKKSQALVATYKSLSAGVPITVANLTVFFDLPFKTYVYGQAIARTHRLGQDKPCTFMQLLLDTGSDENINSRNVDIIQLSKDMVELITQKQINLEFKKLDIEDEEEAKTSMESELGYIRDYSHSRELCEIMGVSIEDESDMIYMLNYESAKSIEIAHEDEKENKSNDSWLM